MTDLESINKATMALENTAMSDDLEKGREKALQHLNAVPVEELEHMAEVWRQREMELMRRDPNDKIIAQRASQLRICASGLEGLIEGHKNDG